MPPVFARAVILLIAWVLSQGVQAATQPSCQVCFEVRVNSSKNVKNQVVVSIENRSDKAANIDGMGVRLFAARGRVPRETEHGLFWASFFVAPALNGALPKTSFTIKAGESVQRQFALADLTWVKVDDHPPEPPAPPKPPVMGNLDAMVPPGPYYLVVGAFVHPTFVKSKPVLFTKEP